jgi:Na+/proline symporter
MSPFIILLGIYLVSGTIIASIVYRAKQTQEEYYIGGRRSRLPYSYFQV